MKKFLGIFIFGLLISSAFGGIFGDIISGGREIISGAASSVAGFGSKVVDAVKYQSVSDLFFKGVGKVIGFSWGCIVPGETNRAAVEAAGGDPSSVQPCAAGKLLEWQKKYPGAPLPG